MCLSRIFNCIIDKSKNISLFKFHFDFFPELSKVSSDLDMRPCTPTHDHEGQRRMSKTLDQAETEKRLPEIIEAYETSSDENDDEPEKIQEEAVSIEADSSIAALANGDLELDQNGNDKCENDPESSHNKDLGGLLSDTVTANGNLVTCVDDLKFGGEKTVDINEQNMSMKVAFEAFEKESAQDFIQSLTKVLSYLMELTTVEEVDDALLQFASNFCSCEYFCRLYVWYIRRNNLHQISLLHL